jgi:hypothetical protein
MSMGTVHKQSATPAPSKAALDAADALDEAWAVLSESMVIREQLSQACSEVKLAIDAIKSRLDQLGVKIIEHGDVDVHPAGELLHRHA